MRDQERKQILFRDRRDLLIYRSPAFVCCPDTMTFLGPWIPDTGIRRINLFVLFVLCKLCNV